MGRFLKAIAVALLACTGTNAQVPDGWYVASAFAGATVGPGGIYFFHPRTPGAPVPVSGLGPDLLGLTNPFPYEGANSVLIRPADGALIVGEIAPAGDSVDLHLITLAGSAVATDNLFSVGLAGGGSFPGQIVQSALLPNGDVLVGVGSISSGPLAGEILGIVDLGAGIVSPVPVVPPPGGLLNAIAVDAAGTTAYLGMFTGGPSPILTVPVPGGGAPSLLASLPGGIVNLAVEATGSLAVASTVLYRVDAGGTVTPISPTSANAVAVETVTGDLAAGSNQSGAAAYWIAPSGASTLLGSLGTGFVSGIAVNPDPARLGAGTPGANAHSWTLAPNPGGLPTLGNATFSLTVGSSPATAPGFFAASLLPGLGVPLLGVGLWLDISVLVMVEPLPPSGTIPLPVPSLPSLTGARLFFQSFHADPATPFGIAASEGVEVTVL